MDTQEQTTSGLASRPARPPISTPLLAADAVILYQGGIVLIRRYNPPFQGCYALPGGFVEVGETVEAAAVREAREETGLEIELAGLIGIYSDPARDPRGHVVSAAFLARPAAGSGGLAAGSDAASSGVFATESLPPLAFDHERIIADALSLLARLQKDGSAI
ncbi:MAG TPA: NUDIX hydrolase [Methanothrix sp.]|nr:NUDIX hydrolase [Methanothrix sp.]HPT19016.1 NUDIX hydrolase [Methanothrix sp.]